MNPVAVHEACIEKSKSCFAFRGFLDFPLAQGFGTRLYDVRFSDDEQCLRNREEFCGQLGISLDDLVVMGQIHGDNILRVGTEHRGRGARTSGDELTRVDGMITCQTHVALAVRTADCASLIFYDPKKHAIGAAHVGWKGSLMDLAGKMVAAFQNNFASRPDDIFVAFGPMIRSCCYEVGEDFRDMFGQYLDKRDNRCYLHLPRVIAMQLERAGIKRNHILDSGFCTSCQRDLFFSYRVEGPDTGRIFTVIMLKEEDS